jgi:hypothetical protein
MFISLHVINGLAWISGKFARVMLGNFSSLPAVPASTPTLSTPAAAQEPATPEIPDQAL